jgi:hypothetical protein
MVITILVFLLIVAIAVAVVLFMKEASQKKIHQLMRSI